MNVRDRMLAERARLMDANPEVTSARELGELFEDAELRHDYWSWQIGNFLASEGW